MALLVLIVLGATLGWLGSIVARAEEPREILRQIGVGLVSALFFGLLANDWTFLGGLSLIALGAASVAAIAIVAIYNVVIARRVEA